MPAPYYKLYNEKTNSAVQATIDECFYTENTLIFNIANVLNYDVLINKHWFYHLKILYTFITVIVFNVLAKNYKGHRTSVIFPTDD